MAGPANLHNLPRNQRLGGLFDSISVVVPEYVTGLWHYLKSNRCQTRQEKNRKRFRAKIKLVHTRMAVILLEVSL